MCELDGDGGWCVSIAVCKSIVDIPILACRLIIDGSQTLLCKINYTALMSMCHAFHSSDRVLMKFSWAKPQHFVFPMPLPLTVEYRPVFALLYDKRLRGSVMRVYEST